MSKIFEAMQHAHRQKQDGGKPPEVLTPMQRLNETADIEMSGEMLSLHRAIEVMLSHKKHKVVQFIGSREGEGTSTVAREFARICATRISSSVLLLDADRHHPSVNHFFSLDSNCGWIEALKSGRNAEESFHRIGETSLFVSPSLNSSCSTPEIFDSPRFGDFWGRLVSDFDLVVVDSSPLTVSPDSLAIAARVDGVIIVVEAEKTRHQTINSLKESLSRVGSNILGLVFNKRRYYIPKVVYKFL